MTQREYAVDLVNSLSDEQVKTLINFITVFSGEGNANIPFDDGLAAEERRARKRRAFEDLCKMTKKVQLGDEKQLLAEYRDERYGR